MVPKESFGGSSPFLNYVCVLITGEAENIQSNFNPWSWQSFGSSLSVYSSSSQTHGDTGSGTGAVLFAAWIFFSLYYLRKPIRSYIFQGHSRGGLPLTPCCSTSLKSLNFIEHHNACALYLVSTSPTPLTTH